MTKPKVLSKSYRDYLKESKDPSLKFYQDRLGKYNGVTYGLFTSKDGIERRKRNAIRNREARQGN